MENESKQNGELRIEVIKKRPKKNAKKYELSTVSEIFDAMEDVKIASISENLSRATKALNEVHRLTREIQHMEDILISYHRKFDQGEEISDALNVIIDRAIERRKG